MPTQYMLRVDLVELLSGVEGQKRLVMLAGPPASGKSTLAKALKKQGFKRHNMDKLAKRDPVLALNPGMLADAFFEKLEESLKLGRPIVDDNLNIREKSRKQVIEMARIYGYRECVIVAMMTPLDQCLLWNSNRARVTPGWLIEQHWQNFHTKKNLPHIGEACILFVTPPSRGEDFYIVEKY